MYHIPIAAPLAGDGVEGNSRAVGRTWSLIIGCLPRQVLTESGLLAALHNGDGHVMWSHSYGSRAAPTLLLPWRSFHDAQHAPEVLPCAACSGRPVAVLRLRNIIHLATHPPRRT